MDTTSRTDAASEAEAAKQPPTITSAIIKAQQSTTEAIISAIIEAEQSAAEAISSWVQSALALALFFRDRREPTQKP